MYNGIENTTEWNKEHNGIKNCNSYLSLTNGVDENVYWINYLNRQKLGNLRLTSFLSFLDRRASK